MPQTKFKFLISRFAQGYKFYLPLFKTSNRELTHLMIFSTFVAVLYIARVVTSQSQASPPACFETCLLESCTDITHLNCVCNNEAAVIDSCVLSLCNSTDQVIAMQVRSSACGITLLRFT
jgi:hypothetical protein